MKLNIQLFASSSVKTATYDGRYLKLTVEETAYNISANTSTVKWTLQSCNGASAYYTIYSYGVYVNGKQVYDGTSGDKTKGWSTYEFPAKKGSKSGTVTVAHGADGTKTLSYELHGKVSSSGTAKFTGSLKLTALPRPPVIDSILVDVSTPGVGLVTPSISGNYTNVEYSIDNTNWQTSNEIAVPHNTVCTFYVRANYVTTVGASDWATSSTTATTEGVAPVLTHTNESLTRTSGAGVYPSLYNNVINFSVSYDSNAIFNSGSFSYGVTSGSYTETGSITSSGSAITCSTGNNLAANKTYYYQVIVVDNFSKSTTYTGSFTTDCLPPGNLVLSINSSSITTSSFGGTVTAVGDTNAPITSWDLYYQSTTDPSDSGSIGLVYSRGIDNLNETWSLTDLTVDTIYNVYFTVTNRKGTTTSNTIQVSTNLDTPVINSLIGVAIDAFSINVTVSATSLSEHTLNYAFSSDGGTTWTTYQASNVYTFTGLNEETTYIIGARVKAIASGAGSDTYATSYVNVTTPTDQAKIRIKVGGVWKRGRVFFKQNGTWVKAKKVYIKQNGQWIMGHDND